MSANANAHARSGYNNKKAQLAQAYQSLTLDLTSPALRTVGNYTLGRTLGSGSYGIVRLSTHRLVKGARVAVKSVSKTHSQLSALVRELHHYRRLSHPHIAQLLEIVATEKDIHLVTELCDGGELFDYLVDKGRLSDAETRRVFGQLMLALHYLHSNGVVHRDLKLENILLDKDGNVKLGDFGFAREFDDGPGNLMSTWCGTTAYASPEMLRGDRYGGKQTDIWSAGVILYSLLTGGLPFDDDDEDAMRELVLKGEYYNPTDVLSPDACNLITSILQPHPPDRPSIEQILAHPFFTRFPSQHSPLRTLHEKLEEHSSATYDEKQVAEPTEVFEQNSELNADEEPPRRLVPASMSVESLISTKRRSGGSLTLRPGMVRTLSSEREGASTPPIQRTPSRTKRRSVSSTMSDLPSLTPVASRIPSTTSLRDHFRSAQIAQPVENLNLDDLHLHPQEPNYLEMCKATNAQPFEEEWERALLQSLSELGFDIGQIKHSVINHACDASGGLWWLLRKQNVERREHLTRIEEEGAGRESEEYLMINTRKQKEKERERDREKERDIEERDKAKEQDREREKDKMKLKMNDQRADFSKRSLPDLNEPAPALTPPIEASTSSLQLPQTSAPSSPSKIKSRSSSISMLQRATTALSGSMLPRKKSDDRSLDESVTPPPSHPALHSPSSSVNQLLYTSPTKAPSEHDSPASSPNKSVAKDRKNLFNSFRTWFTDDKREKRKSKTAPKQHQHQQQHQHPANVSIDSTFQVRRSASHKSNTPTRKARARNARRRESTSSTHSIRSPQAVPMTSAKSHRSSSVHSRRSSLSVHIESGSPSTSMSRRISSGVGSGSGSGAKHHAKSPSMSSVGSGRSASGRINPRAKRHRRGSSSSLPRVRHVKAPSSPLPTSWKHSRSASASSSMDDEKVVGLGLRDSDHSQSHQHSSKTLFLASKRTAAAFVPPPPISVKSPVMKSFGSLRASNFDYTKASPTKNSTFDNQHDEEWVDEDDFAGGIGQGEASAVIGEFESSVTEEQLSVAEQSDEDEIEGVKKLRKKSKNKMNKKRAEDAMNDFKFPAGGAAGGNATANANTSIHQKWRPSVTTAAVIEEDEEDD